MSIEIVSVGSSSSGNSYIIMTGGRTLILDAGLPAKKIMAALESLGTDPEEVDAVLITHEHIDHVRSIRAVSRKCSEAVVVASRGTAEHTENFRHVPEERLRLIKAGERITLGRREGMSEYLEDCKDITIKAFALSHDAAEPLSYVISDGDESIAAVTDSGVITDEIFEAVRDADQLVFEANHDVDMLMFGEYPYPVKVRIKGDRGHLSNDYAGDVLTRILEYRCHYAQGDSSVATLPQNDRVECHPERSEGSQGDSSVATFPQNDKKPLRIMLAHLSFHNNMPLFARQTVEAALHDAGFTRGIDYTLEVAAKEGLTFMEPLNVEDGSLRPSGDISE
ncbi:MAG: MBL fold metallo-hydrolase [Clostridiales bacterium]|nr:MBL fold metallo-hydrolase [Clostridiales bacterium]